MTKTPDEMKRNAEVKLVALIDEAELAVRLCEANYRIVRPHPSAQHALDNMDDDVRAAWQRSAKAALDYIAHCINGASLNEH
jgi:hypothetical protein